MASFSTTHPFAYHAFPLTAARSIWSRGALLGKDDLGPAGQARRIVAATDRRLGFSRFVHFYLDPRRTTPADLPILGAQLQPADEACTICNWNIPVSRRPRLPPRRRRHLHRRSSASRPAFSRPGGGSSRRSSTTSSRSPHRRRGPCAAAAPTCSACWSGRTERPREGPRRALAGWYVECMRAGRRHHGE